DGLSLQPEEEQQVTQVLQKCGVQNISENLKEISKVFHSLFMQTFRSDLDIHYASTTATVTKKSLIEQLGENIPNISDHIDELYTVWLNVKKRIFVYYEKAMNTYFKSLTSDGKSDRYRDTNAMITLNLLRFFVRHGNELENEIME